jgi:transposase
MLPSAVRILLATEPVDMRKSIDGLMAVVRQGFGEQVYSGHLFVFEVLANPKHERTRAFLGLGQPTAS